MANKQHSIKLLFEKIETHEPKLVINLLHSQGTVADTLGRCTKGLARINDYLEDGRVRGVHPWASLKEATLAEQKLDAFMESVLIPIAERNNAVVVCECLEGDCFLSASFNRVMTMQASRHAGAPLITVVAFSCDLESIYRSSDPDAKWRRMRSESLHWRVREKGPDGLLKLNDTQNHGHYKHYGSSDLDMSAANFIIVDGVDVKKGEWGSRSAFNKLKVELVRYLTTSVSEGGKGLPSIALKTGYSARASLEKADTNSSGLHNAVACLDSGQSLIFLDLRKRSRFAAESNNEVDLPKHVLKSYSNGCKALFKSCNDNAVRCDYFDVMAAAYCWSALHNTSEWHNKFKRPRFVPLCEALSLEKARVEGGRGQQGGQSHGKVATALEVQELAWTLAYKLVKDAFEVYFEYEIVRGVFRGMHAKPGWEGQAYRDAHRGKYHVRVTWDMEEYLPGGTEDPKGCDNDDGDFPREGMKETIKKEMKQRYVEKHLDTQIKTTAASLRTILNHDKFHGCNIAEVDEAKRLVETLVRQDRLPPIEDLEGLELLQRAWNEYDVAVHLAARYERYSYLFYAIYLLLGLIVVIISVIASEGTSQDFNYSFTVDDLDTLNLEAESIGTPPKKWFAHVIFGLTLAASLVLSLQSYLNPTHRAEQLRSSAASLESITWLYRTKVGPFERGSADVRNKAPERALLQALKVWNSELVAGTDLEQTDLKRKFPANIYKHFQNQCTENHPRRKKAELQQNRIEALELQLSLLKRHPELDKSFNFTKGGMIQRSKQLSSASSAQLSAASQLSAAAQRSSAQLSPAQQARRGRFSASCLVFEAWKRLTSRFKSKFCLFPKDYDELLADGAQYHIERKWNKAVRAFRKAIASKGDVPDNRLPHLDSEGNLDSREMLKHMLGEFRLGELHMHLGEEQAESTNLLPTCFNIHGPIPHYMKAADRFREVKLQMDRIDVFEEEFAGPRRGEEEVEEDDQAQGVTDYKRKQAALKRMQNTMANEQIKLNSFDDHQSPVRWEAYLQQRVQPAIEGYNKGIPALLRYNHMLQLILLLCTASGAALSYSDLTPYVAIVSATATAISAWIAFGQRSARLVRYTKTVRQLEQLLAWWSAQGDAEKSAKINEFVTTAELIITSERQAWQTLEQTAEETNGDVSSEKKKRGGKARSETAHKTGRSETGPVDIETGQQ